MDSQDSPTKVNTNNHKTGTFRDSDGNLSSKRIVGTVLIVAGGGFLLTIGFLSIGTVIADPTTSVTIGQTLIYAGAGLLGVGVAEKFGNRNR